MLNFIIHTFFERRYTNYYFLNILNSDSSKHIKTKHSWLLLTSMLTLLVSRLLKLSEPYEKFLCSSYEMTEKIVWNCYTRICIRCLVSWCNNFFLSFFVKHLINYPTYLNLKEMFLLYSFFNSDSGNSNSRRNNPSGRSWYLYWPLVAFLGVFSYTMGALPVKEELAEHALVWTVGIVILILSFIAWLRCMILKYFNELPKSTTVLLIKILCVSIEFSFYVFYVVILNFLFFLIGHIVPMFALVCYFMLEGNIVFLFFLIRILYGFLNNELRPSIYNIGDSMHYFLGNFSTFLESLLLLYLELTGAYDSLLLRLTVHFSNQTILVCAIFILLFLSLKILPYDDRVSLETYF